MKKTYAYIANWKPVAGSGMAVCEYDGRTGSLNHLRNELEELKLHIGGIVVDPEKQVLYCTDEAPDHPDLRSGGGGRLFAFRIDPGNGSLHLLNSLPSYGSKPSFITPDPEFRFLILTNHGGRTATTETTCDAFGKFHVEVHRDESNVVLFPLNGDGSLGEPSDLFRLSGAGPKFFQQSAHAHSIQRAPGKNLYAVCDKGGDQVWTFRIDYDKKKLVPCTGEPQNSVPGCAPRYSAFHPAKPLLYVNNEASAIISVFQYTDSGSLTLIDTVSTMPDGKPAPEDENALVQSDIAVSADGRHLYDMLRVVNVIEVWDIDDASGKLTLRQVVDTPDGGRGFTITPDGKHLVVAFYEGGRVDMYRILEDGSLGEIVSSFAQPKPACAGFFTVNA